MIEANDKDRARGAAMRRKLLLAVDIMGLGIAMQTARVRREHPGLAEADVRGEVRRRLQTRPGAEHGDRVGAPIGA
jgi:hypothetical protein